MTSAPDGDVQCPAELGELGGAESRDAFGQQRLGHRCDVVERERTLARHAVLGTKQHLGGDAAQLRGGRRDEHGAQDRATKDIDICPSPDANNLVLLAAILSDLQARQLGIEDCTGAEQPLDPLDPAPDPLNTDRQSGHRR